MLANRWPKGHLCGVTRATLLCACLGLTACQTTPPPAPPSAVELTGDSLTLVQEDVTEFAGKYEATATSPAAATLRQARFEWVVDGKTVKSGTQRFDLALAPGTPATFTLQDRAPYGEASATSEPVLAALRGTLEFDVGGQASQVEFAKSREIRMPKPPTVVMKEFDFARYSPQEAGGTFYIGVKNPNAFPIRLSNLTYTVLVKGKSVAEGEVGSGEQIAPTSMGVFEVAVSVNGESYGADVDALIKTLTLPFEINGQLVGKLFKQPFGLKGDIKLHVSK